MSSSLGLSSLYTITVQPGTSGSPSANAAVPPCPRLQTSHLSSAHCVCPPSAPFAPSLGVFLNLLLLPLTRSGLFNAMLEVSEPEALSYYTLSRFILLILSISKNPTSNYNPLSRSLDSLLCDVTTFPPGKAFFFPMTRTLAAASSFPSGRAYPSLKFSHPLLSSLDPYPDNVGVNISLNHSASLSFINVYAPLFVLFDGYENRFLFPLGIPLHSGRLQLLSLLWDSKGTSDLRGEEVFDWVIFFDLIPLNDLNTSTLLHRSSGSRSSSDISFAPSSPAPGRYFRTWALITYHSTNCTSFYALQLQRTAPSFNYQKAR